LTQDFAAMPDGDKTNVGDRGENLSGGQRQRKIFSPRFYLKDALRLSRTDCR
jgi:ABC-type bacteriocin/lantibiotic exporter with double-glycine peptidase domain